MRWLVPVLVCAFVLSALGAHQAAPPRPAQPSVRQTGDIYSSSAAARHRAAHAHHWIHLMLTK